MYLGTVKLGFQLLGDGKAFLECILAFMLSLGFQLLHKASPNAKAILSPLRARGNLRRLVVVTPASPATLLWYPDRVVLCLRL